MKRLGNWRDIGRVTSLGNCCGCGLCVAICPENDVLAMRPSSGMEVAVPCDTQACRNCGLCGEACPAWAHLEQRHTVFQSVDEPYLRCYVGAAEPKARAAGCSGGIVTALLCHLLESGSIDGAVTTGFEKDNPTRAHAVVARNSEDVLSGAGSKYQMTTLAPALSEIVATPGRYAVVGLPCQIEGVYNACRKSRIMAERIAIKIAIFCGHNATRDMTDALISYGDAARDDVKTIDFRAGAWRNFSFRMVMHDGREVALPMAATSPYRDLWEGMHFSPKCCRLCPDFTGVFADISCGDAWLPEFAAEEKGVSLVLSRTDAGQRVLEEMMNIGAVDLKPGGPDALWVSNSCQIIRKKLHLRTRLWLRSLLRLKGTPRLLVREKASLMYLPAIFFEAVSTSLVKLAFGLGFMRLANPTLLRILRDARFRIEHVLTRLAKPHRLLESFAANSVRTSEDDKT